MNWMFHNLVILDIVPVFELIQDLPIFPAVSHARSIRNQNLLPQILKTDL